MNKGPRESPYQGLTPYTENDGKWFFGRKKETELIIATFFASPLTLLYAESGVGKSSILRAGVAYKANEGSDTLAVTFDSWQLDPVVELKKAVDNSLANVTSRARPSLSSARLADYLDECCDCAERRMMIILDQFEEYFLYHQKDTNFRDELALAVARGSFPFSFLISIREDSLAKLDKFEGRIPRLFDNYLRLEWLNEASAREAVCGPFDQWKKERREWQEIEPLLIETVLRGVAGSPSTGGDAGVAASEAKPELERIKTPYLQLCMTRLWKEEEAQNSHSLRLGTLTSLGGVQGIEESYLRDVMDKLSVSEQELCSRLFDRLVTPQGMKIAYPLPGLRQHAGNLRDRLPKVLGELSSSRILQPVTVNPGPVEAYEIYHDALAPLVEKWRAHYCERVVRRRLTRVAMIAVAAVGVLAVLAFWFQRREAAARRAEKAAMHAQQEAKRAADTLQTERIKAEQEAADADRRKTEARQALADLNKATNQLIGLQDQLLKSQGAPTEVKIPGEQKRKLQEVEAAARSVKQLQDRLDLTPLPLPGASGGTAPSIPPRSVPGATTAEEVTVTGPAITDVRTAESKKEAILEAWPAGDPQLVAARLLQNAHDHAGLNTLEANQLSLNLLLYALSATHAAHLDFTPEEKAALQQTLWREGWVQTFETLGKHANVNSVDVSPNGRLLATAHEDGTARIWDISSGEVLHVLAGNADAVCCVAFNHAGSTLATGTRNGTVRLWNVDTGEGSGIHFDRPYQGIEKVLFSPDDSQLLTLSPSGTLFQGVANSGEVWNASTGRHLQGVRLIAMPIGTTIDAIAYRPDGTILGGQSDGTIVFWDPGSGQQVGSLREFDKPVREILFNARGDQLAAVAPGPYGKLICKLIEVALHQNSEGQVTHYSGEHGDVDLTGAAFNPQGRVLLIGASSSELKVWDAASGNDVVVLSGHADWRYHIGVAGGSNLVLRRRNVVRLVPINFNDLITQAKTKSTSMSSDECKTFLGSRKCPPLNLP
jgi:WD40 repeat protein